VRACLRGVGVVVYTCVLCFPLRLRVPQVNYSSKVLECVFKLHDGPIASVAINEGFCVTASADRYLRVWPLDFSDFFLEAQVSAWWGVCAAFATRPFPPLSP
jgi:hypothetical protein